MTTATDIVNESLQWIGGNQAPLVTGSAPNFDSSAAGVAASQLYYPTVNAVARQMGWDFARSSATLAATGNTPPPGYAYEYLYPSAAVEVWQVSPATPDANNPLPVNWTIGSALVGAVVSRVIWSNMAAAVAWINAAPPPSAWDSLFRQAVVRALAAALATALTSKPETSNMNTEGAMGAAQLDATRNG